VLEGLRLAVPSHLLAPGLPELVLLDAALNGLALGRVGGDGPAAVVMASSKPAVLGVGGGQRIERGAVLGVSQQERADGQRESLGPVAQLRVRSQDPGDAAQSGGVVWTRRTAARQCSERHAGLIGRLGELLVRFGVVGIQRQGLA